MERVLLLFPLWSEEDEIDQDSQLATELLTAADGNREAFFCQYRPILWVFTMFICRFAVPLSLLFKKRALLNWYYLPHNYNLNENEVVFRHVQSTLIRKGFYSHFYWEKAVKCSSERKGTHGSVLSVQPQMCQSSEINDAISGISCCVIFGSSQQFGKMGNANHYRVRFCYAFFNQ